MIWTYDTQTLHSSYNKRNRLDKEIMRNERNRYEWQGRGPTHDHDIVLTSNTPALTFSYAVSSGNENIRDR